MNTIPQLRALKQRKNERALTSAKYGINTPPEVAIELRDLETVISLMERIDSHRGNLTHLLRQRDHFGPNVPTHIVTQINNEREQIATLRLQCSRLGYPIDSHEVDADEVVMSQPVRVVADRPAETQLDRIERKLDRLLALYDR